MKVLNAEQIRSADRYTMEHEPISSLDLMERAATRWARRFMELYAEPKRTYILCGPGNNGGDGLVIARILANRGYEVELWLPQWGARTTEEYAHNLRRLPQRQGVVVRRFSEGEVFPSFCRDHYFIDALFGAGLKRGITGWLAELVEYVNEHAEVRIAVDMPSGLPADRSPEGAVLCCDRTLTFQVPKLSLLMDEMVPYVGRWELIDIGLDRGYLARLDSPYNYVTEGEAAALLRSRPKAGHKGTFGHALLVAGSYGKMGAAALSALACLRSGVGLLTVRVPASGVTVLHSWVPEAMVDPDGHATHWSGPVDTQRYTAIGIGLGIGNQEDTRRALWTTLRNMRTQSGDGRGLVLDADAINILAGEKNVDRRWLGGVLCTPHPGEFRRWAGWEADPFARLELQRDLSNALGCYILYKGHYSRVSTPEGEVYFNSTGNNGMATAGSGDVLTGVLVGLLAQGYAPRDAGILGMYVHGLAGDMAVDERGEHALIARDVVDHLGRAFLRLAKKRSGE